MTTKELELKIYRQLRKLGTYLCFEVGMPHKSGKTRERVDLLTFTKKNHNLYFTNGEWRFYELKVTKADFYSNCKHTFLGHYNYYVMPEELYEQVKQDIPNHIGCFVASSRLRKAWSVKKAKRQELQVNEEELQFAFMQALSREAEKIVLNRVKLIKD